MLSVFRKLFKPAPLPAMLDYLTSGSSIDVIFSFAARAQPIGDKREIWLMWKGSHTCIAGTVTTQPPPLKSRPIALDLTELEQLLSLHNFWQLRHEIGTARDGIHYTVAFAGRDRQRLLRIWNPIPTGSHANLVTQIVDLLTRQGLWPSKTEPDRFLTGKSG